MNKKLIKQILTNAYKYEEKVEVIEEELELTKLYPFKINVDKGRNALVVYKEKLEQTEGKSRLGFHINPYNLQIIAFSIHPRSLNLKIKVNNNFL